jgi:hypothetical protein
MEDSIRSLTTECLLGALLFHAGNDPLNIWGYCEPAKKKMDSSHPVFSEFTKALQAAKRARAVFRKVSEEWLRRKSASSADQ